MAENARHPVKSAETVFAVLEGLKELDGAGVTDLAAHLGMPKSTAHSYLSTLEQEEYVVREGDVYHIGMRFLEYGGYARKRNELYEVAKPEVDRLAADTGNLVNLMIEEHGWGIHLYRGEGDCAVHSISHVGTRVHLHLTAMGKAILANMPASRVDTILERQGLPDATSRTVTDRRALRAELEEIRERGHAIDDEEFVKGLRCVGVPIFDSSGDVLGAVSVAGPTHRFKREYLDTEMPTELKEAANVIELNLTYS
jgi:IclR family transcriptional regulator, acetate operon repressor